MNLASKKQKSSATTGSEYEVFVSKLINGIQNGQRNITHLGSGQRNKIEGISGVSHQIDVSFVDHSFASPTLVLIECKRLGKKVKLEHIKVLQATREDIILNLKIASNIKAIIITTLGVQSGARKYADFYGVDIEQLPHDEKNFTFQYENVISAGISISSGRVSINATATLIKRCEKCNYSFVVHDDANVMCPNCQQA